MTTNREPSESRGPFYFVATVWAASALLALGYVVRYGGNVPFLDEWEFVPWIAGVETPGVDWLWTFHNEHRIVLTKLLFLVSRELFGADFRAPLFFDALVMVLLAAAVLRSVARWRGRLVVSDALIPLLLLHWGHAEVFSWGITSQFVLSTGLLIVVMLVAWRPISEWTAFSAAVAGIGLAGLTVSGANGLALVPPLLIWSLVAAIACLREARRKLAGSLLLAAGAITLISLSLYLFELWKRPLPHTNPGPIPTLETIARFLGMSLGPAGSASWPVGAIVVVVLSAATVLLLLRTWRRRRDERVTIEGLLAGFAAVALLAFSIGWGRAHDGDEPGHALRYSTLAAPVLLLTYLAWARFGRETAGKVVRATLFAGVCISFVYGFADGSAYGRFRSQIDRSFERDALMGRSSRALAERYHGRLFWGDRQEFVRRIEMLRQSSWGPFGFNPDRRVARLAALNRPVFPMISPPPYHVQSTREVRSVRVSGREVLVVHAPGIMRIRIEPGRYLLRGEYGMLPEASQSGASDGVEFQIGLGRPAGAVTRLWNGFVNPGGRDPETFRPLEIEILATEPADLIFRTLPGRHRNETQDRAFWADIEVGRLP